jgi:hypothetical protein
MFAVVVCRTIRRDSLNCRFFLTRDRGKKENVRPLEAMTTMKKLLVLSAFAVLTACGGSDPKPADPSTTTSTTSDPSKADPKAATPAAPATGDAKPADAPKK